MSLKDQPFMAEMHTDAPLGTHTHTHAYTRTQMGESLIYLSKLGTVEKCAGQKELVITSTKRKRMKQKDTEKSDQPQSLFSKHRH